MSPNRRQVIGLAAAAFVLAVSGCATFRRGSELEEAFADLESLLDELAKNDARQVYLASVARRIKIRCRALIAEHEEFVLSFGTMLSTRDISEAQLSRVINEYGERREWLRNDLLRLKYELHDALTVDEWAEVVQVLNHKSQAVAETTISGV